VGVFVDFDSLQILSTLLKRKKGGKPPRSICRNLIPHPVSMAFEDVREGRLKRKSGGKSNGLRMEPESFRRAWNALEVRRPVALIPGNWMAESLKMTPYLVLSTRLRMQFQQGTSLQLLQAPIPGDSFNLPPSARILQWIPNHPLRIHLAVYQPDIAFFDPPLGEPLTETSPNRGV